MRSSTRRACCASTRLVSTCRGLSKAARMALGVISLKVTRKIFFGSIATTSFLASVSSSFLTGSSGFASFFLNLETLGSCSMYLAGLERTMARCAMVLSKPAKYIEQEPSVSRFKKKDAKPEEPVKKEDETEAKKEVVAIDPKKIFRVTFNEITPKAIRAAFDKPRQVDTNLVDAQQARRVLDRIVGYKVSPILWDKVRR